MRQFLVLASVLTAAVVSANCANSGSVVSPSGVEASSSALDARGGGGKPGGGSTGGGGGTVSWVMVTDKNGDRVPSFADVITFAVQTTATTHPWVTLKCYQNGTLVSQDSNGIFSTSLDRNFTLSSSLWTSGGASCTATLENWDSYSKNGSISVLASMSFTAN